MDNKLNLEDRVLGEAEKNSVIALPGEEGHSGLMPSKLTRSGYWEVLSVQGMISLWTVFWLVGGEVIRSKHHHPSGFNGLRSSCLWAAGSQLLPPGGSLSICKIDKDITVWIPWWGIRTSPKAALLFPDYSSLVFTSLPFPYSVQFRSVAQLCPTLCNPMECSTPGLPVHHLFEPA